MAIYLCMQVTNRLVFILRDGRAKGGGGVPNMKDKSETGSFATLCQGIPCKGMALSPVCISQQAMGT